MRVVAFINAKLRGAAQNPCVLGGAAFWLAASCWAIIRKIDLNSKEEAVRIAVDLFGLTHICLILGYAFLGMSLLGASDHE